MNEITISKAEYDELKTSEILAALEENEITISQAEYDELKTKEFLLNLYQKALIKSAEFSSWRKSGMMLKDEDLLDFVALFDFGTVETIRYHCAEQKEREEMAKTKTEDGKPAFPEN